jgi:hypothetical protein
MRSIMRRAYEGPSEGKLGTTGQDRGHEMCECEV